MIVWLWVALYVAIAVALFALYKVGEQIVDTILYRTELA